MLRAVGGLRCVRWRLVGGRWQWRRKSVSVLAIQIREASVRCCIALLLHSLVVIQHSGHYVGQRHLIRRQFWRPDRWRASNAQDLGEKHLCRSPHFARNIRIRAILCPACPAAASSSCCCCGCAIEEEVSAVFAPLFSCRTPPLLVLPQPSVKRMRPNAKTKHAHCS